MIASDLKSGPDRHQVTSTPFPTTSKTDPNLMTNLPGNFARRYIDLLRSLLREVVSSEHGHSSKLAWHVALWPSNSLGGKALP